MMSCQKNCILLYSFAQATFKAFHATKGTAPLERKRHEQNFSGELALPRIHWVVEPFATSRGTLRSLEQGQEHVGSYQSYPFLGHWQFYFKALRDQWIWEAASIGFDTFGQQNTSFHPLIWRKQIQEPWLFYSNQGVSSTCSLQPSQGTIQSIWCDLCEPWC